MKSNKDKSVVGFCYLCIYENVKKQYVTFPFLFHCVLEISLCEINNGDCEQTCTFDSHQVICGCFDGYVLLKDGKSCKGIFIPFHCFMFARKNTNCAKQVSIMKHFPTL